MVTQEKLGIWGSYTTSLSCRSEHTDTRQMCEPQKGHWPCNQICFYRSINYISFLFLRLRQLDIEFMKHLSRVVNIIPVIAKSDTLTLDEKTEFKQRVRMKDRFTWWFNIKVVFWHWLTIAHHIPLQVRKELEACGIECYPQKEFDEDMEDKSDNDKIRVRGTLHIFFFFNIYHPSSVSHIMFVPLNLCITGGNALCSGRKW